MSTLAKDGELTEEAKEALVVEYLATGSLVVRNQLILGHMKLVVGMATSLARSYPSIGDEFLSVGLCTLVDAVESFVVDACNNNIQAYLYPRIKGRMLNLLSRKRPVQMTEAHWEKVKDDEQINFVDYFDQFTVVERECIDLFCHGYNATEIASLIGCSTREIYSKILPSIRKKLHD